MNIREYTKNYLHDNRWFSTASSCQRFFYKIKINNMTKEEFENYKFSVKTEVIFVSDIWEKVRGVEFGKGNLLIGSSLMKIHYSEIKKIRNSND